MSHARLAPSAAHRWMHCPGSVTLTADLPDPETVYSREGTFAHMIAARALTEDRPPISFLENTTDGEFTCDFDLVEHVQVFTDAVLDLEIASFGVTRMIEQRVDLRPTVSDCWGTVDALTVRGREMFVDDYKHGQGVFVEVDRNPQLMIYGVGALLTFPELCEQVDTVTLRVVQPRHRQGPPVRAFTMRTPELLNWGRTALAFAARATEDPKARLVAGEWCQFCPARAQCPALRAHSMANAVAVFPDGDVTKPTAPPLPSTLSEAEVGDLLTAFPLVESWMHAVREHALTHLQAGGTVPGWKLVQKRGQRQWRESEEVVARTLRNVGTDPYETKLKSPAQAEKALGGKKEAKALVATLAEYRPGGATIAPVSDNRPAISSADVFADRPEEKE